MKLEDKLARLDKCLTQKSSNQCGNNQSDILKSCYYQINSLSKNINHHLPVLLHQSPSTISLSLPKIRTLPKAIEPHDASFPYSSFLSKDQTFLNSFSKQNKLQCLNQSEQLASCSKISLLKEEREQSPKNSIISGNQPTSISSSINLRQNKQKENQWRKKTKQSKTRIVLGRQQRYFQVKQVQPDSYTIEKIGLYEAGNLFKTKNIEKNLEKLSIVAIKHEFNPIRLGNSSDLFMTNIQPGAEGFSLQAFIQEELGRHLTSKQPITQIDEFVQQKVSLQTEQVPESQQLTTTTIMLTFKDYQLLQDQSYRLFKARYLSEWGSVLLNVKQIVRSIKSHRVKMIKVKGDHLARWDGKKINQQTIDQLLGLKNCKKKAHNIQRIVLAFVDRLKVAVMRKRIQHRERQIRWVAERLKAIYILRQRRKAKVEKAKQLQQKLIDQPEWQVEVHIPSFSVDSFKRNTTQYMESFQAQYHCLWQASSTPLILVLPVLNEILLKHLQIRLKLNRPVTIITPEVYSIFPPNLSLAAQVYFSHETLIKIEKAVDGRRAVLVGTNYSDSLYELLISQYLNIPILNSIKSMNEAQQQKLFFKNAKISTAPYCLVKPGVSSDQLLEMFSDLLLLSQGQKSWVFKIKGQFKGRGIATVRLNPGKYLRKGMDRAQMKATLVQSLRSILRLKLKVNFQNSVYMVEDFLNAIRKQGGVIEQLLETTNTYELCFKKIRKCQLKSLFKVYGCNFANKVWLSCPPDASLNSLIHKVQSQIQRNPKYLGYLSVTLSQTANRQFIGIDLKIGQSMASSMSAFVQMVDQKRALHGSEAYSIEKLPTRRPSYDLEEKNNHLDYDDFRYLFIPAFPFTDVDEAAKAKLIQELMAQCWNDRHLRLGYPAKVFLSLGLDFSAVVMGRDLKRIKRQGVDMVRELAEKARMVREYRGKQVVRDVFEYGDVIRAISQIKAEQ